MIHLLQFMYDGSPWYSGSVWGNVFVIAVLAPLGWVWSRTKFWPLRPLKHAIRSVHEKLDAHHRRQDEHARWTYDAIHALHRGEPLPDHPHYPEANER